MVDQTIAASNSYREPPTAPGLPLLGNTIQFMTSTGLPVDFLTQTAARYGDLVSLQVAGKTFYLVSSPDLTREVLVKRVKDFDKNPVDVAKPLMLGRFLGNGVLTANFDEWRPQRKLIQPLMHTQHITSYAETMTHMGERLLASWSDNAERDLHADMIQVTLWIIGETMFGMDFTQSPDLQNTADRAQAIAVADIKTPLPNALSQRRDREAEALNTSLTQLVQRIMEERRAKGETDRHDLLSLLMETRDEDGNPMPDDLIRDNILTLFFAGHETTANTLTWVFYYLDQNPQVAAKLHEEVDQVLAGRAPTVADLPKLPYTLMVIKETMRIEPTVSTLPRRVMADTTLGGFHLKEGGTLMLSPYILHHDPRWWSEPQRFDPTRFSAENEPNIRDYAYLPFGGGPRVCIGNHFALMEAQLLLAQIASRYELSLVPGTQVKPLRQVTSSPEHALTMRFRRRS